MGVAAACGARMGQDRQEMDEPKQPPIEIVQADEVGQRWAQLAPEVSTERKRILVKQHDAPAVAIISARDLARLQRFEAQEREGLRVLAASRAAFKDVPDEELEREVDRAIQQARERSRRTDPEEHSAQS